ncbi:MAG: hypothetical protein NC394_10040 [Bacteroides sp.]|nr:hypothetical protein [Bacteroides sp.]
MAKDLNLADYFDMYRPLLTEKQCGIMEMYYFSDLSLGEISEETGITRQAAFNCIKKCEERLTELENALGAVKKREEEKKTLDRLKLLIEKNDGEEALKLLEELKKTL